MDAERRLTWSLVAGGAFVLALVLTTQLYIWINLWPIRVDWPTAFVWSLPQLVLWGLTIPLIAALADRWPIEGPKRAVRLLGHVVASAACALLVLATLDLSDRVLHWTLLLAAPSTLLTAINKTVLHAHIGIAVYWVVLAVHHARRSYRRLGERELRASHLETQLAEAQLSALRAQLDPHFLFNTLNSIGVLMQHDVPAALRMLARLGDVLRNTLTPATVHEVRLHEELAHLRAVLDIEQVRFQDRLRVSFDIDANTEDVAVPYMVLQPLVENAIRHGIGRRHEGGRIEITARVTDGRLRLRVRDDGRGLGASEAAAGFGIGLSNVHRRLEWLYGGDFEFELRDRSRDGGTGVDATLCIPARTGEVTSVEARSAAPLDGART